MYRNAIWPLFARFLAVLLIVPYTMTLQGGCATNWTPVSHNEQSQTPASETEEYAALRERMVRLQLQARDIDDPRVLGAMRKVLRHEFVPDAFKRSAYEDNALPLEHGQTISQPYIVAYMTQALRLRGTERVLEIGTGFGYQAAVLAEIASEVYTIEIIPELQDRARSILTRLGYTNIHYRAGDGYLGWPEQAPFDCIIVTAAPEEVPQPLLDQLRDGGRMIIPIGSMNQELVIFEKEKSRIIRRTTIPVRFVPMTGKARE